MKGYFRPAGATQSITTSGTSAATSNAVGAQVNDVLITATEDAFIVFGAAPVATATNGIFITKNYPHYFAIHGGEKVAAIQATTGGTVYVSELTR